MADLGDRTAAIVKRARDVAAALAPELVEKTIWGSPAGKKRLAKRLVALLPTHSTYVEPFAGSGAVLFAKEPVATEAINDADPEIAEAYKILKNLGPSDVARLRKMNWTGERSVWAKLREAKPTDPVAKLHKFLYLTHFSYGRLRGKSYNPAADGKTSTTVDRIEEFAPRLKKVHVYSGDYERVVRKYDGKSTVHYLDPPYPGYNVEVGEGDFDEQRFVKLLKSLKGQFLITYGIRGELPKLFAAEGFDVKRIRPPRTIRAMRGVGGSKVLTTLLVSNYGLVEKRFDDGFELENWSPGDEGEADEPTEAAAESEPSVEKAQWTREYVDELPDDAFLFIARGGHKDASGRTEPRSLRHFPVRDAEGDLDVDHLRDALGRIPQSDAPGLGEEEKRALQDKARRLLAEAEDDKTGKREETFLFEKTATLLKGVDPDDERYVLGIVLEPDVVDAQGDTYSAEEIRSAAHMFMEDFGGLGLMHKMRVNGQVKILESYLAPTPFQIGEREVKKGTWLLAVRILSDELWDQVRDGKLTGFSIGGSARRVPEAAPPPRHEAA